MKLEPDECRRRLGAAASARLATVTPDGAPHIVPIVFALVEDRILSVVDAKPKSTTRLQRVVNLEHEPRASVLVDHYEDDWDRLWWVRADGTATVTADPTELADAVAVIARRHPQYLSAPYLSSSAPGPVIRIDVHRWVGWAASPG